MRDIIRSNLVQLLILLIIILRRCNIEGAISRCLVIVGVGV